MSRRFYPSSISLRTQRMTIVPPTLAYTDGLTYFLHLKRNLRVVVWLLCVCVCVCLFLYGLLMFGCFRFVGVVLFDILERCVVLCAHAEKLIFFPSFFSLTKLLNCYP